MLIITFIYTAQIQLYSFLKDLKIYLTIKDLKIYRKKKKKKKSSARPVALLMGALTKSQLKSHLKGAFSFKFP